MNRVSLSLLCLHFGENYVAFPLGMDLGLELSYGRRQAEYQNSHPIPCPNDRDIIQVGSMRPRQPGGPNHTSHLKYRQFLSSEEQERETETLGIRDPNGIVAGIIIRGPTARTAGCPLGAERGGGSQLPTGKETGPQGPEFCQQPEGTRMWISPRGLQVRTRSLEHLDFSVGQETTTQPPCVRLIYRTVS